MSLLDVFKDFEYQDDDDHSNFFQDTFSQLLDEPDDLEPSPETSAQDLTVLPRAKKVKVNVEEFEEAFTALKSIEAAHQPLSQTSINAFLHHKRNIQINKRTVKGLTWPEHPETFQDSRLICAPPTVKLTGDSNAKISNLLYCDEESESEEEESVGLCKMSQSKQLHETLLRTVHSIYNQKTFSSTKHLDPRLAHSIAHRTAFLLQSIFTRAALNRQSAVRVLKQFPQANDAADVDNVTSNWETVAMAAEQLIGQAAFDRETFNNFSSRVDEALKKIN